MTDRPLLALDLTVVYVDPVGPPDDLRHVAILRHEGEATWPDGTGWVSVMFSTNGTPPLPGQRFTVTLDHPAPPPDGHDLGAPDEAVVGDDPDLQRAVVLPACPTCNGTGMVAYFGRPDDGPDPLPRLRVTQSEPPATLDTPRPPAG